MHGISETAKRIGFRVVSAKSTIAALQEGPLPAILHWNQNHFVVLYKVKKGKTFYIADPGKGIIKYSKRELESHWISLTSDGQPMGIAMFFEPGENFSGLNTGTNPDKPARSFRFLTGYLKQYDKHFIQILAGLIIGCVLQLIMPFLTQAIVDIGIKHRDIGFIWLILLGELMIVTGRTATDFVRRWLLLHISMRINISLVSDFFIKLLKLPMSFFDTKLMGDLLQRIGDHNRVQNFLTGQMLNVIFTFLSFVIFGIVLFVYNPLIFGIFAAGSVCYGVWISSFLRKRKVLVYELFEHQTKNQHKT